MNMIRAFLQHVNNDDDEEVEDVAAAENSPNWENEGALAPLEQTLEFKVPFSHHRDIINWEGNHFY